VSVQLQALADDVFEAGTARDRALPSGMRPVATNRTERQVAMVQAFTENASGGGQAAGFSIRPVDGEVAWLVFEDLIRADAAERGWTDVMTAQVIALHRWRAGNTPQRFYLALAGGRTVARVGLFQHRTIAYLHALFTHPDFRRRGAGAFLAQAMGVEARAVGCERVALQCTKDSWLPAYFGRLGFRAVGERQIWTTSD
jgi:N-acetylglutamate synthase-like GNAT family acetyltransferase